MSRQYLKVKVTPLVFSNTYYYQTDKFTLEEALADAESLNPGCVVEYKGKEEA